MLKNHIRLFLLIVAFFFIEATVNATSILMEMGERGAEFPVWKAFALEYSSIAVISLAVPFIFGFDLRYPIASNSWPTRLMLHVPLSIVFSIYHISVMVGLRKVIFGLMGDSYQFTDIGYEFIYEYRKDAVAYAGIVAVIYVYREILRLRRGEAQIEKSAEERIMVSKSGQFRFIEAQAVDWVEAAGNYVELHVGDETYMLRATMKDIESRLGSDDFARVHRSTIVRRAHIDRIMPLANGDKRIFLKDGTELRLSRRYNENLKQAG